MKKKKKHYITGIRKVANNTATKKAIGYNRMVQIINDLEEDDKENKENAKFFSQQLIQQQDATKYLHTKVKNKSIEQKPTTDTDKLAAAAKILIELMTFANGGYGIPNPNPTGKQRLWQKKKP